MGGLTTRQLSRKRAKNRSRKAGQLQPGDMLQNRYRIVGTLGVGGFSSVYQARDMRFPNVTKLCAVKEMINTAPDPKVRALTTKSFEREASILATLDHPAVVGVYDYFTEAERNYLVLEFIRGKDLESRLSDTDDFFPQEQVMDWAFQICDVLAYLHGHKPDPIIFRDLKPSNIMLDPHGRIRLIDFGIAKVFQSEEKNTTIGTEGYAPPEQYRGEASPAGDVYGVGATLHHLLTRQDPRLEPPFSFHERPIHVANPKVSPALEQIIMRAVSYNAEERYQDASTLKQAFSQVAGPVEESGQTAALATARLDGPAGSAEARPGQPNRTETFAVHDGSVKPIWAFRCEDEIRSAPAVADDMVFVGVYDNNLYALARDDGSFAWKYPAKGGIASSPSFDRNMVLIGSADHHVYNLHSHNGRLNWRFGTQGAVYSSPRAKFGHVFFGSDDNHLYAVNTSTGRLAWKSNVYSEVRSTPLITEDFVYFGTEGGYVFCVDLSGETKWQFQARRAVTSTPTVAEDMVFVGSLDNTVYALDVNSGWAIWRFRTQRPIISSPTVHNEVLYIGSADHHLYAIDIYSGRKLWSFETEGQIASSPAIHDGAVYFGSTDGAVYCVDLNTHQLRWRFETGGMVISSPSIEDGIVYIGSTDRHLYALPA